MSNDEIGEGGSAVPANALAYFGRAQWDKFPLGDRPATLGDPGWPPADGDQGHGGVFDMNTGKKLPDQTEEAE